MKKPESRIGIQFKVQNGIGNICGYRKFDKNPETIYII